MNLIIYDEEDNIWIIQRESGRISLHMKVE